MRASARVRKSIFERSNRRRIFMPHESQGMNDVEARVRCPYCFLYRRDAEADEWYTMQCCMVL